MSSSSLIFAYSHFRPCNFLRSSKLVLLHLRYNAYDGEKEYWVKTRVTGKWEAEESSEVVRRQMEDDQARVDRSHIEYRSNLACRTCTLKLHYNIRIVNMPGTAG